MLPFFISSQTLHDQVMAEQELNPKHGRHLSLEHIKRSKNKKVTAVQKKLGIHFEHVLVGLSMKMDCVLERKHPKPLFEDFSESFHDPMGLNLDSSWSSIENFSNLFVFKTLIFRKNNHLPLVRG